MAKKAPRAPSKPGSPRKLSALRKQAAGCRRCDLWKRGTQTVFGEGPLGARVMLVGEQPGDQEDLAGAPFVGPAGQLLRESLAEAGLDPEEVYLTNAVKHFKWEPRGKRRIHEKPNREEVLACRMWLNEEIDAVKRADDCRSRRHCGGHVARICSKSHSRQRKVLRLDARASGHPHRPPVIDSSRTRLGRTQARPRTICRRSEEHRSQAQAQ